MTIKQIENTLLLGLFSIPLMFLQIFPYPFDPFKLLLLKIIVIISIFLLLFFKINLVGGKNSLFLVTIIYIIAMFVNTLSSPYTIYAQQETEKYIWAILFTFLIFIAIDKINFIQLGIKILLINSIIISIYGIIQYIHLDPLPWGEYGRIFSTLGHADELAAFLAFPIGFILSKLLSDKTNKIKNIILLTLYSLCLIMTLTRAGWVAFGAQILCWLLLIRNQNNLTGMKKIKIVTTIVIIVLFGILVVTRVSSSNNAVINRLTSISNVQDPSIWVRVHLWEAAIKIILKHPWLGVGPGNFSYAYLKLRDKAPESLLLRQAFPGSSHNEFLDTGVSYGILGLIIYLILWYIFFKNINQCFKNKLDYTLTASLFLAGIGIFVNLFFIFHSITTLLLTWWLWGAASFLANTTNRSPSSNFSINIRWPIKLIILGVLSYVIIMSIIYPSLSSYYYKEGNLSLNKREYKNAWQAYSKAIQYDPLNEELFQVRGSIYEKIALSSKAKNWFISAKNDYTESIKLTPENPRGYAHLGRLCGQAYELYKTPDWYQCAIDSYSKALFRDPYNPFIYHDRGIALKNGPEWKTAEESFRECIKLAPSYSNCAVELGRLYIKQKLYSKAITILKYTYTANYKDPAVTYWYIAALIEGGSKKEAAKILKQNEEVYNNPQWIPFIKEVQRRLE